MRDTIAQTRSENVSTLSNDPLLAREHKELWQAKEITKVRELRVKKLEKKGGSRTHKLKRLYKVGRSARIVSSDEASLGGSVVLRQYTSVSACFNKLIVEITCQALAELKSAKPSTAASTRPRAKGLVIHEQEHCNSPTVSSQNNITAKIQDKVQLNLMNKRGLKRETTDKSKSQWNKKSCPIEERAILFQNKNFRGNEESTVVAKGQEEKEDQTTNKSLTKEYHVYYFEKRKGCEPKDLKRTSSFANIQELFDKAMPGYKEEVAIDAIPLATKPPSIVD
ncbi:hypothetical protein Tco_1351319 [Tanacetum coccineum]